MARWFFVWVGLLCGCLILSCSDESTSLDAGAEQTSQTDVVPDEARTESKSEIRGLQSGRITVVTYNVHGLPASITKDDTNGRLKAIGPMLNSFDIAGLQEVFTEAGHKSLTAGVKHPTRHRFNKALEGRAYGAGLFMLSKFKALMAKQVYFEHCNGTLDGASDCLASKGFHMVRYELAPGVEVDVYNSHFEAGSGSKDLEARAKNLVKLRDSMLDWSKGRALLFLGDTNLKPSRPSDQVALKDWIDKVGLIDSCESVGCEKRDRIDRVFFRGGDKLAWTPKTWNIPPEYIDSKGTPLSDHDPIVVTLEWKEVRP